MIKRKGKGFELDKSLRRFLRKKPKFMIILGRLAQSHFVAGFRTGGGMTDDSRGGWLPRKRGTKADRRTRKRRGILIQSNKLRDSINYRPQAMKVKIIAKAISPEGIDYAPVHNEGIGNMPKREFIGHSKMLEKKVIARIRRELDTVFK